MSVCFQSLGDLMSDVEEFCNLNPLYEWERLDRNRTEFHVTMRAFREHAPSPPADVLDIGGGPDRYSIAFAEEGYHVTIVDISENRLEFARKKALEAGVDVYCLQRNATHRL